MPFQDLICGLLDCVLYPKVCCPPRRALVFQCKATLCMQMEFAASLVILQTRDAALAIDRQLAKAQRQDLVHACTLV